MSGSGGRVSSGDIEPGMVDIPVSGISGSGDAEGDLQPGMAIIRGCEIDLARETVSVAAASNSPSACEVEVEEKECDLMDICDFCRKPFGNLRNHMKFACKQNPNSKYNKQREEKRQLYRAQLLASHPKPPLAGGVATAPTAQAALHPAQVALQPAAAARYISPRKERKRINGVLCVKSLIDPNAPPAVQISSASLKKKGPIGAKVSSASPKKKGPKGAELSDAQMESARLEPEESKRFWAQNPSQIWTTKKATFETICQIENEFRASDVYVPPPPTVVSAAALRKRKSRKNQALRRDAAALEAALESDPAIDVPSVALPTFRMTNRAPGMGKGRRDRRRKCPLKAAESSVSAPPPPVVRVEPKREYCAFCPSHFALRKYLKAHIKTQHPALPILFLGPSSLPTIWRKSSEAPAPVSRRALNKLTEPPRAALPLPTAAPAVYTPARFTPADKLCIETELGNGASSSVGDIDTACKRSPEFAALFQRLLGLFAERNWHLGQMRARAMKLIRRHFAS